MAFNLKEYILYRTEIKRELFNAEVDENFKAVSNPWVETRVYEAGHIVYHPVEVIPNTGSPTQALAWFRAKKRTTQGIFELTEWDMIGGVGTGDLTIQGSNSFGRVTVNYTGATGTFQAGNDFTLSASVPNDNLRLVAGQGASLQYDSTTNTVKILNSNSTGEVNVGQNIGSGVHKDIFAGMDSTVLTFKGVSEGNAITLSDDSTTNNVIIAVKEADIELQNLNAGSPTADKLSDVQYTSTIPNNADLLQWQPAGYWQNVPLSSVSGTQGVQGPQGIQGVQGAFGTQGTFGNQGTIGSQGVQGIQGNGGNQGIQGIQGVGGVVGNQGTFGNQGTQGTQGSIGADGLQGVAGNFGGATFDYEFHTDTATADPGFSYIRLNNTTQNAATQVYINDFGVSGVDVSNFLSTILASTSTIKGHIRITNKADSGQFLLFQITDVVDNTGWWTLTINNVGGSTTSPFQLNEDILLSFVVTGDLGPQGVQGIQGNTGIQGIQGVQGTQGAQGTIGSQGVQGIQGVQGTQGAQGTIGSQGVQGVQGSQGKQGTQGVQGVQGVLGSQGVQGIQGRQGTQGTIGSQGIIGTQGTIGSQGTQGQTGSGSQGIQGIQGRQGTLGTQGTFGNQGTAFGDTTTHTDGRYGFIAYGSHVFEKGLPRDANEVFQCSGGAGTGFFSTSWGPAVNPSSSTSPQTGTGWNWKDATNNNYFKIDSKGGTAGFQYITGDAAAGDLLKIEVTLMAEKLSSFASTDHLRLQIVKHTEGNVTTGAGLPLRLDVSTIGQASGTAASYEEWSFSNYAGTYTPIVFNANLTTTFTLMGSLSAATDRLLFGWATKNDESLAVGQNNTVTINWKAWLEKP